MIMSVCCRFWGPAWTTPETRYARLPSIHRSATVYKESVSYLVLSRLLASTRLLETFSDAKCQIELWKLLADSKPETHAIPCMFHSISACCSLQTAVLSICI